jgi:threonine dehydratase
VSTLSPGDQPLDVTRFDVENATERIAPYVRRTPVMELEQGAFGVSGRLWLKLELLQHTGSFKPRGAFNRMLTADIDDAGVLAASGGNFGLAVAFAAQRLGHSAEIFVPSTSPSMKIERIRSYGATVHVVDGYYDEAYAACEERAWESGAAFLHPYDQPAVVAGQGTLARELEQQQLVIDTVLVAVGGAGLIGGVAAWFAGDVKVVGVEPYAAPTLHAALNAGAPVDVEVGGLRGPRGPRGRRRDRARPVSALGRREGAGRARRRGAARSAAERCLRARAGRARSPGDLRGQRGPDDPGGPARVSGGRHRLSRSARGQAQPPNRS